MFVHNLALVLSVASAWPWNGINEYQTDRPDSAAVVEALKNPDIYEQLTRHHRHRNDGYEQTPLTTVFDKDREHRSESCGPRTSCPAFEGEMRHLNGRSYRLYCFNAPWGSYFWLPKSKDLEECENHCHSNDYDCNGLTFYPSTGSCAIIHSEDAAPYIWDNGYAKIGAIPEHSNVAFRPGELCPLPGSDNQVWDYQGPKFRYKLSCRNQFNVDVNRREQLGAVRNVEECAKRCGQQDNCYGFHYYQPTFPGGRADGARNCDLIHDKIEDGDWVPVQKPLQYLSGLAVRDFDCGDEGWNRDEGGTKQHRGRRGRHGRHGRHEEDDESDEEGESRGGRRGRHGYYGRQDL